MSDGNEKLYNFKKRSDDSGLKCLDPSKTVQADLVDADLNVIVARYGITGTMPQGVHVPEYADYEDVFDYQSARNALVAADEAFASMPAEVRNQFDNDPASFFVYAVNPDNYDGLVELGLASPRPIPPSPDPQPAPPPPSP